MSEDAAHVFSSPVALRDTVIIDEAISFRVLGVVTGVMFREGFGEARVSWWNNGKLETEWFDFARIKRANLIP